MYSVVTVDDEPVTRMAINNYIDRTLPDFQVVSSFGNGIEALEYLGKNNVDVVITDILMPKMDGLELTQIIHETYPDIKICIVSGYGEFEYARKAMRFGVSDYLLKPLDFDELSQCLDRFRDILDTQQTTAPADDLSEDSDDLRIEKAKNYIRQHFCEDISRKAVASEVYLSPAYFSRLFMEKTGESFISYLTTLRMRKAAELLDGPMNIEDIAKEVGYQSRNRFSINFRQYSGCTPVEYRRYKLRSKELASYEKD